MNNDKAVDAKNTYAKFRKHGFRENQLDAIRYICESDKKVVVLCSPTGSGKSLINMVAGRLDDEFTYLCSSKQLQAQLRQDFPECKVMQGRNNYACQLRPELDASACSHSKETKCPYKGKPCKGTTDCMYEIQKCTVLAHPYKILNYHYFLYECVYVGKFSNENSIVLCDEADTIDNILTGFVTLEITWRQIQELGIGPPERKTATSQAGLPSWEVWGDDTRELVKKKLKELDSQLQSAEDFEQVHLVREYNGYNGLKAKLDMFLSTMDSDWIYEQKQNYKGSGYSFLFRPTWISGELSEAFLFKHGGKFVLTSATFPPREVLARTLGVAIGDIDYAEMGSSFPLENRPVYISPVANMSYKTFDENVPILQREILRILDKYPEQKGIIHTTSWKLNKVVMDLGLDRLITHTGLYQNKEEAIEKFKSSKYKVFVSPSSIRGLDLPDDYCRFNIIAKAPFLSLGDKLTKQRTYSSKTGQRWYQSQCAQDIVQAAGRGVRHKHDWCHTFILDVQAFNLITRHRSLFPDYFIDACEVV